MTLLKITKNLLQKQGIDNAIVGNRIGDISNAIQQYCEKEHGFGIVRVGWPWCWTKFAMKNLRVPNFWIERKRCYAKGRNGSGNRAHGKSRQQSRKTAQRRMDHSDKRQQAFCSF